MPRSAPAGKRPLFNLVVLIASIVLAAGLFLYIMDASFRDDGRILAPGPAFYVPILWIVSGLLVSRFPKISMLVYAVTAMLLFFERDDYRGFLWWGLVSLVLTAMACWYAIRTESGTNDTAGSD